MCMCMYAPPDPAREYDADALPTLLFPSLSPPFLEHDKRPLSFFNINKSTRGGHEKWSPPTPTLMGEMGGALKVEPPLPPLLGKIVGE